MTQLGKVDKVGSPSRGFPSGGGIRWQQVLEAKGPGGRRGCLRDGEQEAHSGEGVPDQPASCLLWAPALQQPLSSKMGMSLLSKGQQVRVYQQGGEKGDAVQVPSRLSPWSRAWILFE